MSSRMNREKENRDRAALLSRRDPEAGFTQMADDMMEKDNDALVESLRGRVSMIKDITSRLDTEVREQNRLLSNIDSDMGGLSNMVTGTIGRVNNLISSGAGSHMCYLALFVVVVFVLLYWVVRR